MFAINDPYVGQDGQTYFYTEKDFTAYQQGAKDAYYSRPHRTANKEYAAKLNQFQRDLYRKGYAQKPYGQKETL